MKRHFLPSLMMTMLLYLIAAFPAGADITNIYDSGVVPKFVGHPMLAQYGYKAEVGAFSLGLVGQGSIQSLDHMTDNDPENYAATVNLVQATVAAEEIVKIMPDPETNPNPEPLLPGKEVGFVVATDNAGVSVLSAKVLNFFGIYLYDRNGELIKTIQGKNGGETSLIGLDIATVSTERGGKITATIPDLSETDNKQVYGIGFGLLGVDAKVGAQLRMFYGFVDDFVNQPIITKYYPQCSSSVGRMVAHSMAKKLINNDLKDGAAFDVVLGISGGKFTVMAGEEIPAGVEVGFIVASGTALKVKVGEVRKLYTLDQNGDTIESTQVIDAVGLQVAGGGGMKISMMTTQPCYGICLDWIEGLTVNLGGTTVKYAYARMPEMRHASFPFDVEMDAIPHSIAEDGKRVNKADNLIHLHDPGTKPLNINGKLPDGTTNLFNTEFINKYGAFVDKGCRLILTRSDNFGQPQAIYMIMIYTPNVDRDLQDVDLPKGKGMKKGTYYFDVLKESGASMDCIWTGKIGTPDANGNLDLNQVMFRDEEHAFTFDMNDANQVMEYNLYYIPHDTNLIPKTNHAEWNAFKNSWNTNADEFTVGYDLGISETVTTPDVRMLYEPVGYQMSQLETNEEGVTPQLNPMQYSYLANIVFPHQFGAKISPFEVHYYAGTTPVDNTYLARYIQEVRYGQWKYMTSDGTVVAPETYAPYISQNITNGYNFLALERIDMPNNTYTEANRFTEILCTLTQSYQNYLLERYPDDIKTKVVDGVTYQVPLGNMLDLWQTEHMPHYWCPVTATQEIVFPTMERDGHLVYKDTEESTDHTHQWRFIIHENDASRTAVDGTIVDYDEENHPVAPDERLMNQWIDLENYGDLTNPQSAARRAPASSSIGRVINTIFNEAQYGDEDASYTKTQAQRSSRGRDFDDRQYKVALFSHSSTDSDYDMAEDARAYVPVTSQFQPDYPTTYMIATTTPQTVSVQARDILTSLTGVDAQDAECEYYDILGRRVAEPIAGQILICRRGGKAQMVRVPNHKM